MVRLATFLGLRNPTFEGVLGWVLELRQTIGVPATLAELGLQESDATRFATQAFHDPSTGSNPLPMTVEDFVLLYRNCIRGELSAAY
jgi:alcohol dehydrogenase class IV